MSPHRGRRVLSGAVPYSPFGHSRGPLWRFCEAGFTLDPSKSRIPRRGRSDATNAPQIGDLQVTGFRRPSRPRRPGAALNARMRPLAGMAAHRSDCLVRGVPKHYPGHLVDVSGVDRPVTSRINARQRGHRCSLWLSVG